ncbi:type IV pilus modification protein PilV [Ferrimonas senticii]|uniref:type IV pilus modification protein PilV n=1 Tax=Ferrimonas senticii TaxID=394566 RepID=UPI000483DC7C|nr:type IV pilus modification protein PilV [Ferrimonas senticii]
MSCQPITTVVNQRGFSLLELLIAVLVVAIGLLGFARMQVTSLQNAREVRFNQYAYSAVLELGELIRAEPAAAIRNEFNFSNLADGVAPTSIDCSASAISCTRAEFATYELAQWYRNAATMVPQLRFAVSQPRDNLFRLLLTWDPTLTGSGVADCSASADGQTHQCVEVELWIRG